MITTIARSTMSVLIASIMFAACGPDKSHPHYSEKDKQFDPQGNPGSGSPTGSSGGANPSANSDFSSKPNNGFEEISPDRLVFQSTFQGKMLGARTGVLKKPLGGSISEVPFDKNLPFYNNYKSSFQDYETRPIDLTAMAYFGDGETALFKQIVSVPTEAENPDKAGPFVGDSTSGTVNFRRITKDDEIPPCPASFVCIDQMKVMPKKGAAKTYCFTDLKGNRVSIPNGVEPGGSKESMYDLLKPGYGRSRDLEFGKYMVRRYTSEAADIDCKSTREIPELTTTIKISGRYIGDDADEITLLHEMRSRTQDAKIDYGVAIIIRRLDHQNREMPENEMPFLDELTNLQSNTTYFIDDHQKNIARIKKEFRRKVNLDNLDAGDSAANYFAGYYGIRAEFEFKFCRDLLVNSQDLCSADTPTIK